MKNKIQSIAQEIDQLQLKNATELENYRLEYLSKKGKIGMLMDDFRTVPSEDKKEVGALINVLKTQAQSIYDTYKEALENSVDTATSIDYTRSVAEHQVGARHPLSIVRNEILEVFNRIGFNISDGPEVEDDWHNFSALNFPPEHPARDMQDTFFIKDAPNMALRTHTSSIQVRIMEGGQLPIRTISPGRVYRNEAVSARAHCQFHQVEGLYIDKGVSFADLKQTLLYFSKELYGANTKIRLRPSYFPFTEPSAEMDISCPFCAAKGCNICKGTGWVEILGCGMVDPQVLTNCGIDSTVYSGFAFGMGIERITMLKYQVNDLRLFFENDVRFIAQFKNA